MSQHAKFSINGHLGADSELDRGTHDRLKFSVGVSSSYKNSEGEWVTRDTSWFDITLFGVKAEQLHEQLAKGTHVEVAGRIENSKWTDKDGNTRYGNNFVATSVTVVEKDQPSDESE